MLAAECEQHWADIHVRGAPDPGSEHYEIVMEAIRKNEAAFGRDQSAALRANAAKAITAILKYQEGGEGHVTLKRLRTLRNEHLAHRQLKPTLVAADDPDGSDEAIETFYNDMAEIVRLLRGAAEDVDYRPEDTAEIRRRHAALFWAAVRGEATEGHPSYQAKLK